MTKVSQADITRVKAMGFLLNRGSDRFSARVITGNGTLTAAQLRNLAECAERYGNGRVAFTSRLTVEIPGIALEDVEKVREHVAQQGMMIGGTGAKVRPVVACKGTTCVYGNCDTQGIAQRIHEAYFLGWGDVALPHKFKIAVGGCPNSCMKPSLNDFGIEAHRPPQFQRERCRGCKKCAVEAGCPVKAARVQDGVLVIDDALCNTCGVCAGKCPFGCTPGSDQPKFQIFVGGTWGKKSRMGTPLPRLVGEQELFPLLEKTLLWFRENAFKKERLGAAIDRVGEEAMLRAIEGSDLLERKDEILAAALKER